MRSIRGGPAQALVLAATLALAAPPAEAQSRVTFDRRVHLEGYQAATFSEFADLYDLSSFAALDGQRVGEARLAEIRATWDAERERVRALLDAERAEPRRWAKFLQGRQLAKHAFFSKIGLTRLDDVDGFVVYVQDPKKPDPAYAMRVARESAARLLPLREYFEREYVLPAGLERREDFPIETLIILSSSADFATYGRLAGARGHYRAWSAYDGKLCAAVLFEDPFEKRITPADKDRSARHAYAHLLLHAHEERPETPLHEDWLREGLATHLADLAENAAGWWAPARPPKEALQPLLAATQARETVLTHFRRIGELYTLHSYGHVYSRAQMDRRRLGLDPHAFDSDELYRCYWRQALLLVDFLQRDERRAGFLRLLADELSGNGGASAFRRAFSAAGSDASDGLEALDRAFLEHLFAEHRRLFPEVALAGAAIEAVLEQDVSRLPAPGGAAASAGGPAAGPSPGVGIAAEAAPGASAAPAQPFEPAELAPRRLGTEATLALCLELSRRGRSGDAEARLAQALAGSLDAEAFARLERAHAQIAAWNRLRGAWFADLAARGASFRFEHDGRAVRAPVERVEGGVVHLGENRSGRGQLELDALDPLELVKQMGKGAEALPDGWARALPQALAGDLRAARLLDADDPVQAALAADLAGELPELLARGFPLGELEDLSRTSPPDDAAGCEQVLARLAALARDHGTTPDVGPSLAAMRAYALLVLDVLYDLEGGVRQRIRARWEDLPRGRVRLSYDFEDPGQLDDFVREDGYREDRRAGLGGLVTERKELAVRGGALVAHGAVTVRHRLGFSAPTRVRYELSFLDVGAAASDAIWYVLVGICDDGRGSYVGALGPQDLEVVEGGNVNYAYAAERPLEHLGAWRAIDLELEDSGAARLYRGGDVQQELTAGALRSGGLFLLIHSDHRVHVRKLVIEAAIDDTQLATFRAAWIEEQARERGL